MKKILISILLKSGNTEKIRHQIAEGAQTVPDVTLNSKKQTQSTPPMHQSRALHSFTHTSA
jgi:hypothetical protein